MIPWKLDHFMKVLCGVKTSDESRLRSLILEGVGDAPSFETIQALFDSTKSPRRSTFSKPKAKETHQDIGMIHDFMKGAALEEAFHDWDGRYSSALQILREVIWSPETFKVPSEGTEFMSRILGGFPHLISSILHVEKWAHGKLKGQPMRDFPTKLPPADFGAKNRESSDARKVQVFEIHAFLLYLAALELDFSEWEPKFELMPPSCFVPSFMKGDVAYPMKGFWTWLRTELNCSTWVELAEKLQTTEQSIKNAANTKSLADAHSWSEFWRMMNNAQEAIDRTSPFMVQTSLAYGLARIIQEHASRCLDVVLEDFCEADDIENFYLRACPRSGLFEKSAF